VGIKARARLQQHLDGGFRAESRRAVQGRFPFGAAIPYEVICWNRRFSSAVGIRALPEQNLNHGIMGLAIGGAERRVQR